MAFGIEPSEGHHTSMSMFEDYPAKAARLSGKERKGIRATAKSLFEQSPSDAISYLASQRGYTNFRPDRLMGKLMARPVDYEKFKPIASSAFQSLLGRDIDQADWDQATDYARSLNVRDPYAFQSLLNEQIALRNPNKIMTQADREWQSMYGNMQRDAQGNLQRGMVTFDPERFKRMASDLKGVLSSNINISSSMSSI
jgi:hypothetical protein